MNNYLLNFFENLDSQDIKINKQFFEEQLKMKTTKEFFLPLYVHLKYYPEYNIFPRELLRETFVKSNFKLPMAVSKLKNKIQNKFYPLNFNNSKYDIESIVSEIDNNGYALIYNFINEETIDKIKDEYKNQNFYCSSETNNKSYNSRPDLASST